MRPARTARNSCDSTFKAHEVTAASRLLLEKEKARGGVSGGFRDPCSLPVRIIWRAYAFVRAESTPLASEPMLLPIAR